MPPSARQGGPRYASDRPKHLRTVPPWNPYAHYNRTLPAALERLVPDLQVPPEGRVLDYGCAELPYRRLFPASVDFAGADIQGNPHASLLLNPDGSVPVEDGSFDAVLSTQVLEHVSDPGLHLSECFRVLRPGGRMLLSTHGVYAYHPDPVDLWRWTCAGLELVVREAGFTIVRFEGVIGLAATGLQLFEAALAFRIPNALVPLLALIMQPLIALADRLQSQEARNLDAAIFALVAAKP